MLRTTKKLVKLLSYVFVAFLFVTFAVSNRDYTSINLYPLPFAVDTPKYVILLAVFIVGVLMGLLYNSVRTISLKIDNKRLRSEISQTSPEPAKADENI